jgi:hypothetical protein
MTQCIDYPHKCKFGFQSVFANIFEQLDILQGLSSTNLSNRLPSYFELGGFIAVADTYGATHGAHELVKLLRLIAPLIDW